jgi:hypothetical protein
MKGKNIRTVAEVLAQRATVWGCCGRNADNGACDCYETAIDYRDRLHDLTASLVGESTTMSDSGRESYAEEKARLEGERDQAAGEVVRLQAVVADQSKYIARLQRIVIGLAERVVGQSELLTDVAEAVRKK